MNMTARQMLPAIGSTVSVRFEQIQVVCNVVDVKQAYGTVRVQVVPTAGAGSQWVELPRLRPLSNPEPVNQLQTR